MGASAATPDPAHQNNFGGTFHFGANHHHRTAFPNLFSARRQAGLQQLATQLAGLHPAKVFVENEPHRQAYWGSFYAHCQQRLADTVGGHNEIVQVGMRTARLAGLPRVDKQQSLPYQQLAAFNQRVEQDTAALRRFNSCPLFARPFPHPRETQLLADYTLTGYLLYLAAYPAAASYRADTLCTPRTTGWATTIRAWR